MMRDDVFLTTSTSYEREEEKQKRRKREEPKASSSKGEKNALRRESFYLALALFVLLYDYNATGYLV